MNKYGVPASHVIRHYDVTGKICPNPYVYNTSAHTWDALKKAGSVRAASDTVLTGYEKPADQSETVKKKRAEYGEGYYKKYAAGNGTKYYRVRKSWTDAASQLGAFTSLENAKSACKAGYTVYDDNGKAVYTAAGQQTSAGVPFSVQVDILDLNIRTGAGTNYITATLIVAGNVARMR